MKETEEEEDQEMVEEKKEQSTEVQTTATTTTTIQEPEAEDQEEENTAGKYMLLDRLMKFIRSNEKPLNAVLSGYFSKLMTLLINRK